MLSVDAFCGCGLELIPVPCLTPPVTAGARLIRLIFKRYVVELGWHIELHPQLTVNKPPQSSTDGSSGDVSASASLKFLRSLTQKVAAQLAAAQADVYAASRWVGLAAAL